MPRSVAGAAPSHASALPGEPGYVAPAEPETELEPAVTADEPAGDEPAPALPAEPLPR